jgi:hypothetical protein
MRYALISDIHANLPALEAVLADVLQQPDRAATYHLGDLVGTRLGPTRPWSCSASPGSLAWPETTTARYLRTGGSLAALEA